MHEQDARVKTLRLSLILLPVVVATGCGTTRWSDTRRTATEQLLVTDAVDQAVQQIRFEALAGQDIYFDDSYLDATVDRDYVISSIRQHLLASGCVLKEKREDATYVVEARAGAVGTDRHDLLYGLPATNIPTFVPVPGIPTSLPEIPLAKRTNQIGVAKLAVFAYHRETGQRVWQSGLVQQTSRAKDFWFLGAGPFQKRSDREGTLFAGQRIKNPLVRRTPDVRGPSGVDLTAEATFIDRSSRVAAQPKARRPGTSAPAGSNAQAGSNAPSGSSPAPTGTAGPPAGQPLPPVDEVR